MLVLPPTEYVVSSAERCEPSTAELELFVLDTNAWNHSTVGIEILKM